MDEAFMLVAVHAARDGIDKRHGGPFGACVVKDGEVVSTGHNTVLKDGDPTCHAEMNAIRAASAKLGTHLLKGCTLYTTCEPCPMCLCASLWARVDRVVVGVPRETAAEYGFDDAYFYEQVALAPDKRQLPSDYGVAQSDCEAVFADWRETQGTLY